MPAIASTSGRLHKEFVGLLFLQDHRETDRFFAASGVQSAQSNRGTFHSKRAAFLGQLKAKIGSSLAKAAALRVNLNVDGAPITSRLDTHPSLSLVNLVSIFRCSSSAHNRVPTSHVDCSNLVF